MMEQMSNYIHGGDIYSHPGVLDFSANITPFGTHPKILLGAEKSLSGCSVYPDPFCRELTMKLSEEYQIPPDQIIIGNGAADLIFASVLGVKPKKAVITAPAFAEYEQALKTLGCSCEVIDLPEEDDFKVTDEFLSKLNTHLEAGAEMVFLCSPDNPTGQIIEKELLIRILSLCLDYRARVVLDESFWQFAYESSRKTMADHLEEFPNLFILRSFTKMYGIAGLRLGYGLTADTRWKEEILRVRQPWSVSGVSQAAGIAALSLKELPGKTKAYVDGEREHLTGELKKLGFKVYPSRANYVLVQSKQALYEALLDKKILIRNCNTYRGLENRDGLFYYRFAIRLREENEKLLKEISEIMRK